MHVTVHTIVVSLLTTTMYFKCIYKWTVSNITKRSKDEGFDLLKMNAKEDEKRREIEREKRDKQRERGGGESSNCCIVFEYFFKSSIFSLIGQIFSYFYSAKSRKNNAVK